MTHSQHLPLFSRLALLLMVSALWLAGGCATGPQTAESASAGHDFIGTWSLQDTDGSLFNLVIRPDGTAITNWTKGESGAKGEFGRWEAVAGKITISYDDGWRDIITRKGKSYWKTSYGPGAKQDGAPTNQGPAKRVKGERLPFVGVWETTAVENDAPYFIALKSDGTAAKTIVPKAKGNWKVVDGDAVITWDDGWVARIHCSKDKIVCEAWQPGKNTYPGTPTGAHKAWMVGAE